MTHIQQRARQYRALIAAQLPMAVLWQGAVRSVTPTRWVKQARKAFGRVESQ